MSILALRQHFLYFDSRRRRAWGNWSLNWIIQWLFQAAITNSR